MGIFDGLRNAQVFERGTFMTPGVYELTVERCLVKTTRKSGDAFIVEFTINSSAGDGASPVNSKTSWFQKLSDKNVAFGAIKEFLYAALGYDWVKDRKKISEEVDPKIEQIMQEAIDMEKNALRGIKVKCQVNLKKTQKGADFSAHSWAPAS